MTMDRILANINEHIRLDEAGSAFLASILIPRPFRQGEVLIQAGDPARYILFTESGYLMTTYNDINGADHVIQFSGPGWWATDIHSLSEQAKTRYTTKALSEGAVWLLPRSAQQELFDRYPLFDRYFRVIFQKGLMRQQLRYIEGHSTSAEERYQSFIAAYPELSQSVPQKYIASYLGITPEFLSKIRRKLAS